MLRLIYPPQHFAAGPGPMAKTRLQAENDGF